MKLLPLTLGLVILSTTLGSFDTKADCLSKYDSAFKDKRTFVQFKNGNAQGAAKIGDYAIQIPIVGAATGVVACAVGCLAAASIVPLAAFTGSGLAIGAGFALAIPVKMAVDGSVDLGKVRKTIRQAKEFSESNTKLKNPLKKVVKRVQLENPALTPIEIASAIVQADQNETFCTSKLTKFKNIDDLVIVE